MLHPSMRHPTGLICSSTICSSTRLRQLYKCMFHSSKAPDITKYMSLRVYDITAGLERFQRSRRIQRMNLVDIKHYSTPAHESFVHCDHSFAPSGHWFDRPTSIYQYGPLDHLRPKIHMLVEQFSFKRKHPVGWWFYGKWTLNKYNMYCQSMD